MASNSPSFQRVRLTVGLHTRTYWADRSFLALAVHQHGIRVFALQWIFAVVIALLLLTAALAISLPPVGILCTTAAKLLLTDYRSLVRSSYGDDWTITQTTKTPRGSLCCRSSSVRGQHSSTRERALWLYAPGLSLSITNLLHRPLLCL